MVPGGILGTLSEWVEYLLKEMLSKHFDERYMLLKVVLDDGLRELREVADLQSKEEQHRRLVALQNMQRWLPFHSGGKLLNYRYVRGF